MLYSKILVNTTCLTALKLMISMRKTNKVQVTQKKKIENQQLQVLLNDDAMINERLRITQQIISDHFQAIGTILKQGKWMPHN